MNCETTTELLSDYFDGGLAPDERKALEDHLQACSSCTSEYKAFTESMKALHDTKPLETTSVFTANVRAAASQHADRKENLLTGTGGVTVVTPKADPPPAASRPSPVQAWVPWALAATLVAAFGLGLVVSRGGRQSEVDEAVRLALQRMTPPEPRTVEVSKPVDERKVLEKNGLVMSGGEWIPRRYKEAFDAGKICLGGQMMEKEEAVKALVGELPQPKPPDPPAVVTKAPTIEEVLERHNYTKVNDVPVPKAWVEKWGEGYIQVGVAEWKKASDFKEEFIKEHGLVEYRGKLMSREQAEQIQSQQLVKAPDGAPVVNDVTRALDGLQIGPPVNFRGLTVYPLIPGAPPVEPAFVTLHDALGSGKLEITDTGALFSVQVRNAHEADVLLVAGAVLVGGRCARVVAEDRLVRAGKTELVAVYCVEPASWRPAGDKFARESGHYLAPPSIRRSLAWQQGQGAVWSMLSRKLDKTRPALADLYRKHAESIVEIRGEFARLLERESGAAGVAVAMGDSLEFVELFQSPALLRIFFDRILSGAALEALEREADPGLKPARTPFPNSVKGVKQFLEGAFAWTYEAREDGFGVRKESAWVGRAVAGGGFLGHGLFFAVGAPAWERRPALAIPEKKLARAMSEYEARLKSKTAVPSRKVADIQDLGSIGGPEATMTLLRHLGETDATVRSAVIQELGASRDPKATEPLVQLLAKSRQDAPLFAETVRALGRLGDEAAVEPLLKQVDAGDPAISKTVILGLPELLLQVRTRDVLQRATQRLVVIYESVDSVQRGEGIGVDPVAKNLRPAEAQVMAETVRTALTQVTEIEFGTAAGCRKWWNDRDTRDRFLRERTGK